MVKLTFFVAFAHVLDTRFLYLKTREVLSRQFILNQQEIYYGLTGLSSRNHTCYDLVLTIDRCMYVCMKAICVHNGTLLRLFKSYNTTLFIELNIKLNFYSAVLFFSQFVTFSFGKLIFVCSLSLFNCDFSNSSKFVLFKVFHQR